MLLEDNSSKDSHVWYFYQVHMKTNFRSTPLAGCFSRRSWRIIAVRTLMDGIFIGPHKESNYRTALGKLFQQRLMETYCSKDAYGRYFYWTAQGKQLQDRSWKVVSVDAHGELFQQGLSLICNSGTTTLESIFREMLMKS